MTTAARRSHSPQTETLSPSVPATTTAWMLAALGQGLAKKKVIHVSTNGMAPTGANLAVTSMEKPQNIAAARPRHFLATAPLSPSVPTRMTPTDLTQAIRAFTNGMAAPGRKLVVTLMEKQLVMRAAILSLSRDGSTVAIGAGYNAGNGADSGHVRVFATGIGGIGTAPTFASAATNADGTKVVLTYNEALSATTAATTDFAVTTDGAANAVTAVAVSGSTVELTLTNTVKNDQTVTVAYTDPSGANDNNAVQDSAGNDVASLNSTSVTNNSTVAGTPPTFASAATNADGTKVVLTYNEALSATTAATTDFAVTTDGAANAVTAVAVSGSTVELTLTNTVASWQTVTVSYADPSNANDNNAVQDSQGNDVAS